MKKILTMLVLMLVGFCFNVSAQSSCPISGSTTGGSVFADFHFDGTDTYVRFTKTVAEQVSLRYSVNGVCSDNCQGETFVPMTIRIGKGDLRTTAVVRIASASCVR